MAARHTASGVKWGRYTRRALALAVLGALTLPAGAMAVDTPMSSVTEITGAERYWAAGFTGKGVDIAIIDTGVTAVPGLDGPGRILHGPDLSFDSQSPTLHQLDAYGHGTHLGSIVGGRDGAEAPGPEYANATEGFRGMAPDARIINIKAGDAEGGVDVSQVIASIDWVVEHRNDAGMNIGVLLLAYGTDSTQAYDADPLTDAVAEAWKAGIVVVVAGGNGGGDASGLLNPARAPFVIAVGAADTKGTRTQLDDTVAAFSSRTGEDGRSPDVVAPGVSILGLNVPGSYVDDAAGDAARVEGRFLRGSGTSQAAAVVAGAVALIRQQRPEATPDEVKALLKSTAKRLRTNRRLSQGSGAISLRSTLTARTPWNPGQVWIPTRGDGSLQASRGTYVLSLDDIALDDERDVWGVEYDAAQAASLRHAGEIWVGGAWRGIQLVDEGVPAVSATLTAPSTWSGRTWSGRSWSEFAWTGRTWQGRTWAGRSWSGRTWAGAAWADTSFTAAAWR